MYPKDQGRTGFTLIEIIFAAVIVVLLTILIARMVKARAEAQTGACINNLRQLNGAKWAWSLECGKSPADIVTWSNIHDYVKLDPKGRIPTCAAGGVYTLGRVGDLPTCTEPSHVLPPWLSNPFGIPTNSPQQMPQQGAEDVR